MSASKRKTASNESAVQASRKRPKSEGTNGPVPRTKVDEPKRKSAGASENRKPKSSSSVLLSEQPAFPRGGADILTPVERKQIQARAVRDAAAEHQQSGDLFGPRNNIGAGSSATSDDEDFKELPTHGGSSKPRPRPQKHAKSTSTRDGQNAFGKDKPTAITGLSYKKLAIGSNILGTISAISERDLTVSLPNNLVGFVPLTEISAPYLEKLQTSLATGGNESDDASSQSEAEDDVDKREEEVSLHKHFVLGQYLRVCVTALGQEDGAKSTSKKRIELSINPSKTNPGLTGPYLSRGCVVQAAVASIEDHGVTMDVGIAEPSKINGFIPFKTLEEYMPVEDIRVGSVMLCGVVDSPNGSVVQLTPNLNKIQILKQATNVDVFLPGAVVEVLVSQLTDDGLAGKVIGLVDATADIVHSGSYASRESFAERYSVGRRVRARIISTFPVSESKKLGVSVLEHVLTLPERTRSAEEAELKASTIIDSAQIVRVAPGLGVYLDLGHGRTGFAHISRLSDKKVDHISETTGAFKLGSRHKARVLDYNRIDGLQILSLQVSVIEQVYLRIEDVKAGHVVKGTIEKLLIGPNGVGGLIVNLAGGISGLVPGVHMSDVTLLHPERKFREGGQVSAKVLSVNSTKRQIRLTLKKTLVNSDQRIWTNISDIAVGDATVGTLMKVDARGALVQFYDNLKGYLPVSEMSEAYIKDATEHFKPGQVLTVHALSVNVAEHRLTVSCRDQTLSAEATIAAVEPGSLVNGKVFEKSHGDLLLRLEDSNVIARLDLDHVSDGSEKRRRSNFDKIRVDQRLESLLVLEVQRKNRLVILSNKQSLTKAAQAGQFLDKYEDLREGQLYTGFVSNVTDTGIFVRFGNGISGLIAKSQVPVAVEHKPKFDMQPLQAVTARVMSVDYRAATPRFWLTMRDTKDVAISKSVGQGPALEDLPPLRDPVDADLVSFQDLEIGKIIKVRITSVKDTQINVELAREVQGRIDVSAIFDGWNDIKDRKQPLRQFSPKQILSVRVLGAHDTRNHRFLPLSHRSSKNTVYELSAKPSVLAAPNVDLLSPSDLKVGTPVLAFVNNMIEDNLMVNISPTVRGRIKAIDVSDDLNLASDLAKNFPIGSAIKARVSSVDLDKNRLDLTGRSGPLARGLTVDDLSVGMLLPGRITKISNRSLIIQIAENLVGVVDLIDLADDLRRADPAKYQKNEIVRVCVVRLDVSNKKINLSMRPSRVLSSSIKVADPEITSVHQLNMNDVVRGFVANVTDQGLFVTLGHGVTALVRVTNLSDAFLKQWKDDFHRDQLVEGKVIAVDHDSGHVQLSLKQSALDPNYQAPRALADMQVGDIVTGKVVKVETFGVFVLVDHSENVRGLCHRSEIAEQRIEDVTTLFEEGDAVKVKVLKIDSATRRINFGMKASYLKDAAGTDDDESVSEEDVASNADNSGDGLRPDRNTPILLGDGDEISRQPRSSSGRAAGTEEDHSDQDAIMADASNALDDTGAAGSTGLSVGGFDWYGLSPGDPTLSHSSAGSAPDRMRHARKTKSSKSAIQNDITADLDTDGPRSSDDFERLLLSEPYSSVLWLQYMAFYLDLGDTDLARNIAERALTTIGLGQDYEKLNIWIAMLNLENTFGDDDSLDAVFQRALTYNDQQEIYRRLISIYIQSGKHDKADSLFQEMAKKFTQDPKVWINYATFLFDTHADADAGRALLSRALQVLPSFTHFDLTTQFARLEFKAAAGLPERGRTIFEGLINSFPKRVDLFNIMLDLEMAIAHSPAAQHEAEAGAKHSHDEQIRALFTRIVGHKLKPKQAKHFFKRWLMFEEGVGDAMQIEAVKARAATWVKSQG